MTRGLVVGKFWPPHAGHHHLVATAAQAVDELVVVVGDSPTEDIPWDLRVAWMREAHPGVTVTRIEDRWPGDSRGWAEACTAAFGRFDAVFTSEDYGEEFAACLGCRHVSVDRPRTAFPISGTRVRRDPLGAWEFLSPPVRAYFARRVVLVGAESTGKTTLAARLAAHLRTTWVEEYGRRYSEGLVPPIETHVWRSEEFEHIAATQAAHEEAAARGCAGFLVCDTDAFATAIWHHHYVGAAHPGLLAWRPPRSSTPRLYLLPAPDVPFVQDGLRDGEHRRGEMTDRFVAALDARGERWVWLTGGWEDRFQQALAAMRAAWPEDAAHLG